MLFNYHCWCLIAAHSLRFFVSEPKRPIHSSELGQDGWQWERTPGMDMYLGVCLDNRLEGMGRNCRYLSCGIYHWQLPLHDGSGVQVTSRSKGDVQALRVIGGDCRQHLGVTDR